MNEEIPNPNCNKALEKMVKQIHTDFCLAFRTCSFKKFKCEQDLLFLAKISDLIHNLLYYSFEQAYMIRELEDYITFITAYDFSTLRAVGGIYRFQSAFFKANTLIVGGGLIIKEEVLND